MAKVDEARRRVEAALDRLDAVVERTMAAGPGGGAASRLAQELAGVRADRDRLAVELSTLQQRYDDLKSVTETASQGLGRTIERVRGMIAG